MSNQRLCLWRTPVRQRWQGECATIPLFFCLLCVTGVSPPYPHHLLKNADENFIIFLYHITFLIRHAQTVISSSWLSLRRRRAVEAISSHSACKFPSAGKCSTTELIQSVPQAVAPSDTITTISPSPNRTLLFSKSTAVKIPAGSEVDSTNRTALSGAGRSALPLPYKTTPDRCRGSPR